MLLPRLLLPMAVAAHTAYGLVITAYEDFNITVSGKPTLTSTLFTTTIFMPTTSPYALPSGASVINVAPAKGMETTYALQPTANPIVRPSARETLTVGQPYTVRWKPTPESVNGTRQEINLMLYKGTNELLEPVQLIGGFGVYQNGTYNSWVTWGPPENNGSATFTPREGTFSGDDYVIVSNAPGGVNESPFFSIHNPDPAFSAAQYEEATVELAPKKGLSGGQKGAIAGGVVGGVVLLALFLTCFLGLRKNGFLLKLIQPEVDSYTRDIEVEDMPVYPKKYKPDAS